MSQLWSPSQPVPPPVITPSPTRPSVTESAVSLQFLKSFADELSHKEDLHSITTRQVRVAARTGTNLERGEKGQGVAVQCCGVLEGVGRWRKCVGG